MNNVTPLILANVNIIMCLSVMQNPGEKLPNKIGAIPRRG